MLSGESSQSYLVRAEAIRQRLVELDRNSDTTHDYKHIVRGLLSPTYDIEKRILAGRQVLNLSEIEYVMNQADRDLRSAARKRERDDAAHALVMAGTGWHGGGRGQPWHGRGAGRGGQLEHRETSRWCDLHHVDTHSNSECNLQQAVQRRHMGFGRGGGRGAAAPGQSQPRRHSSQDGRVGSSWTEAHGQQYHTG
ncbi:unnamed protein product, partial [Pylaiella littoralis]